MDLQVPRKVNDFKESSKNHYQGASGVNNRVIWARHSISLKKKHSQNSWMFLFACPRRSVFPLTKTVKACHGTNTYFLNLTQIGEFQMHDIGGVSDTFAAQKLGQSSFLKVSLCKLRTPALRCEPKPELRLLNDGLGMDRRMS